MAEIFKVEENEAHHRLDLFLVGRLGKDISRSEIQKLIKEGLVLVGGKPATPRIKLKTGQVIEAELKPKSEISVGPQNIPLEIIYEDDNVVVVNKPVGMVVHPAPGNQNNTLVNALMHHGKLASLGGPLRPGIVHRLDKDVSGILIAAKTDATYLNLVKQFKERKVERRYIAVVKGKLEFDEGEINLPLGRHPRARKKMAVCFTKSKHAQTRYKLLKRGKDFSVVELGLGTGRTHQIRVHLAYLKHPIIGDEKYGFGDKSDRIMLHAKSLGFYHPRTGKYMEFSSKIPPEIAAFSE
ncbi:MAG: RluA family pseudouridine synthase [Candidatus Omnitrophota bacterium]